MKITREWAMPNSSTFSIPCIKNLILKVFTGFYQAHSDKKIAVLDPFVGKSPFLEDSPPFYMYTNDLDDSVFAHDHVDAAQFIEGFDDDSFDIVLFDPPFSPRQVSECYKKMGRTVNMKTTQASYWSKLKQEIARITYPGSMVISCAWNSGGIGKKLGFEIEEIMLVAHGGWHNDTIVTVEKKVR